MGFKVQFALYNFMVFLAVLVLNIANGVLSTALESRHLSHGERFVIRLVLFAVQIGGLVVFCTKALTIFVPAGTGPYEPSKWSLRKNRNAYSYLMVTLYIVLGGVSNFFLLIADARSVEEEVKKNFLIKHFYVEIMAFVVDLLNSFTHYESESESESETQQQQQQPQFQV